MTFSLYRYCQLLSSSICSCVLSLFGVSKTLSCNEAIGVRWRLENTEGFTLPCSKSISSETMPDWCNQSECIFLQKCISMLMPLLRHACLIALQVGGVGTMPSNHCWTCSKLSGVTKEMYTFFI